MGEKLRCAVIGAGGIGLEHMSSLGSCPQAATVALCEIHPQRAREATQRYKIPRCYSDYRELLEQPDIDAVIVALPNCLHAPVAQEALQARKHVLVEKPMATNFRDAAKTAALAVKMKRTLMVAQKFRLKRQTQIARSVIQRGELGEIYHARSFWLRRNGIPRIGSWFTQKQMAGGGCLCDLGVHMLDTGLYLLGDFAVTAVCGQIHARFGPRGQGELDWGKSEIHPARPFDVEDYAAAFLKFKSGKSLVLEASWAAHHPADAREYGVDLLGTNAGLSLYPPRLFRPGPSGYETIHLAVPKGAYNEDVVHHFVGCVIGNKKTLVPLEESLKVQQVLEAIYAAAATGKEVVLKDIAMERDLS